MTVMELIHELTAYSDVAEQEVQLRIVYRDSDNTFTGDAIGPIQRVSALSGVFLVVEDAHIVRRKDAT